MKISVSRYQLKPINRLSGRAPSMDAREGALIRVEDGAVGYADCHPWPELGDAPLEEQLRLLSQGRLTPLTENSLEFAQIDGTARSKGVSLFDGLEIPESHLLLTGFREIPEGFKRVKIKMGLEWEKELSDFKSWLRDVPNDILFRIDLNTLLDPISFSHFLIRLGSDASRIDFIEDPVPWDPDTGFENPSSIALALDRGADQILENDSRPDVLIVKPAITTWRKLLSMASPKRQVITSYLDHPLGQLAAAWVAADFGISEICGLASHTAYERHAFSEALQMRGSRLLPSEGTGFGFDDLLSEQEWRVLND